MNINIDGKIIASECAVFIDGKPEKQEEQPQPIIDTVVTTSEAEKNQLIADGYELVSEETKYYTKTGTKWKECDAGTYNRTAAARRKKETTYTLQKTIYPSS